MAFVAAQQVFHVVLFVRGEHIVQRQQQGLRQADAGPSCRQYSMPGSAVQLQPTLERIRARLAGRPLRI